MRDGRSDEMEGPAVSSSRIALFLFAISLSARIPFMSATTDDAFITYRYVENILAGHGFVYNEGERVLGVTTPLYTLLLALMGLAGMSPLAAGPWVNVFADSLVAPLLAKRAAGDIRSPAIPGALLYALCPLNAFWAASGMETGLYCLAIAAALVFYDSGSLTKSTIACAAAVLLRIDAGILLAVLSGHRILSVRRVPWKQVALVLALITPWFVFSTAYFGTPIPNSVIAKAALPKTGLLDAIVTILARGFLHLANPIGIGLAILAIIGVVADRRLLRTPWFWFPALYALAYTLTRSQLHPWYYPPAYTGYLVLAGAGVAIFIRRWREARWTYLAYALLIAGSSAGLALHHRKEIPRQVRLNRYLRETGIHLRTVLPPGSTLFLKDIGYLGYYSGARIHDFAGLVSPELTPFRSRLDFAGAIEHARPDYALLSAPIVDSMPADGWFRMNYDVLEYRSSGDARMVLLARQGVR